jgi:HAD superfamily phosphatase (TIGR01668 family)
MKYFAQQNFSGFKNHIIIIDIDGTLTATTKADVSEVSIKKITELNKHNEVYICSNSPTPGRNEEVAKKVGARIIHPRRKKPSRQIMRDVKNPKKKPILVIGDKYWTDGRFANHIGAKFLKVRRIEIPTDYFFVKLIHRFDDFVSKIFEK